jgi:HPt (histidine-containing phosphotransfer) domain-containing protein
LTDNNPHIIRGVNVGIDVSMLYNISANDQSFISKIVETFLRTFPDTVKKIDDSLREGNWENVYLFAHHAKSSLSIIRIGEVFDWVVQVEVNAKNRTNLDIIPGLVKKIKDTYLEADELLRSEFLNNNAVE